VLALDRRDVPLGPVAGVPLLAIADLAKRRERGGVAFELTVPEFALGPGSFVAVVGSSGCGKSTLLDLLALVLRPDRCARFELALDGGGAADVAALWSRHDEAGLAALRAGFMGYVLQTGGLLPFLSVLDNILLPLRIGGWPPDTAAVTKLATRLGIEDKLGVKPQYLSGGQRQRVAVARALVHGPRLVLADEPTAAVDEERAKEIMDHLRQLAVERGTTVVVVSHDRDLVLEHADAFYGFRLEKVSETLSRSVCLLGYEPPARAA
jgi:putative ABC transport system ATP-binding protein